MINIDDKTRNALESLVPPALVALGGIAAANNMAWLLAVTGVLTGVWNYYTSHKAAKAPAIEPAQEAASEKVS